MSKVRVHMMASLDGYVAGPNQSVDMNRPGFRRDPGDWELAGKAGAAR